MFLRLETVKRHGKKMSNRKPSRRHSDNMLIFQRSSQPGCPCPPSGRPNGKTVSTKKNTPNNY